MIPFRSHPACATSSARRRLQAGGLAVLIALSALPVQITRAAELRPGITRTPMTLKQYMALDGPAPSATLAYDGADSQRVELFVPPGPGPFPVAVLIHGGCWSLEYGGLRQMHDLAGGLVAEGIAVWNIEYRRVDEPGGGYPGTYQDVAHAIDLLAAQAGRLHLDTTRVVAIGHSAGGQLVQWLAGRSRVPPDSPLHQDSFLPIHQVIGLGSLADLERERHLLHSTCDRQQVELTGRATAERSDPLADTNPLALLPNGSHTLLVHGSRDHQVPPSVGRAALRRIRAAGDSAELLLLPGAGHFDEVAFHRPAWRLILPRVRQALGMSLPP